MSLCAAVLAKYPPEMVAEALKELVKPAMLSSQLKQTFENSTYTAHHSSAEAEKHVKRVMNYFLMPQHRQVCILCADVATCDCDANDTKCD